MSPEEATMIDSTIPKIDRSVSALSLADIKEIINGISITRNPVDIDV